MKTLDQYAILYAQEEIIWQAGIKLNWPNLLKKIYLEHGNKRKSFLKEKASEFDPPLITHTITGFSETVDHYDIDESLQEKFGEAIQADSEGGQFFAYTSKEKLNEVLQYLESEFPDLDVSVYSDTEPKVPQFRNWTDAKNYVKEHELDVPNPLPDEAEELISQVQDLENQIKQLEEKKQNLIRKFDQ